MRAYNASNLDLPTDRALALFDRNRRHDFDPVEANLAAPGQHLDASCARLVESVRIGRVDVAGDGKAIGRGNLNDEKHDRARASSPHGRQLAEMLGAAFGHAIREFGQSRLAHEMDVLDF